MLNARQPKDAQLVEAMIEFFHELVPDASLPISELRHIAEEMVELQKIDDADWAIERIENSSKEFLRKRNLAKIRGYYPFTCLGKRVYTKLKTTFGNPVLILMQKQLKDPEDIYPKWAYRFAYTCTAIGLDVCTQQGYDLYHFVTKHSQWEALKDKVHELYLPWIEEGRPKPELVANTDATGEEVVAEETTLEEGEDNSENTENTIAEETATAAQA